MNLHALNISRKLQDIQVQENIPADIAIDQLIGIDPEFHEERLGINELIDQYGSEHRTYQADTTYSYIYRMYEFLRSIRPKSLLDIGSGNGRILFFGALLLENTNFYGIELVKERVEYCNQLNQKMGLNIQFINGDVLEEKLPPVDCICLINSLFPSMMPALLEKLKTYAESNPFLLIAASTCNMIISEQDWIREVDLDPPPEHEYDLRVFKTV